ncbi:DNA-directed RNA polymerase subunit L [Candidatus Woesearchaeota archaeon]|nr:DNA-directed RNA polymerase subunit L [Candidatus Woesearchaeota archaeon]
MEIKVVEDKANRFVFEIEGLGHTFCNALKDELRNDSSVTVAAYNITHPLSGVTKFFVETEKSSKPRDVLDNALKALKKHNNDFLKAFKAMK